MRRLVNIISLVVLLFLATGGAVGQTPNQPAPNGGNDPAQAPASSGAGAAPGAARTGGAFKVGGGVSPPRAIYSPDPEYSEQARKAKFEGTCVLWLIIGPDGAPRDIRLQRPLGLGLDEQAVEAVRRWKFEPARKDGRPVAVMINVEVTFRLDGGTGVELPRRANSGDAHAELELSEIYLCNGEEKLGYQFLLRAANSGLPEAQFQMGEYTARHGDRPGDNIVAYMWYSLAERNHYKHSDKKLKELASKMSPENVKEAQADAQAWKPSK